MANDEAKPRQAVDPDEPFDVWWPKYTARVAQSVADAEQHLEVPAGTISSIPMDADFVATVKTYAVIEPILNDLIVAHPPQIHALVLGLPPSPSDNYRAFVVSLNMGGNTGKLRLAEGLGLLAERHVDFIRAVTRIRNRYAHNVKNMHKSLTDMLKEEQENNSKIVENITGIVTKLPSPLPNGVLKLFVYHRLADYLSNALDTLKPPPLPDGLLGALLGSGKVPSSTDK